MPSVHYTQEMQVQSLGWEDALEEHGNSLRYFCLENPVDRGTLWTTVHQFSSVQSLSRVQPFETP